jgi:hypothetical protein
MKLKRLPNPILGRNIALVLVLAASVINVPAVNAMGNRYDPPATFSDDFSAYDIGSLGGPNWGNYVVSGDYTGQTAGVALNPISGGKGFRFYENCEIWGMCYQAIDFQKYQGLTDFTFSTKAMKTIDTRDIACGVPEIVTPLDGDDGEFRFNITWGYYGEGIYYCDGGDCTQLAGEEINTPGKSLNTWYSMEISFAGEQITITYEKGTANERQYVATHEKAALVKSTITLRNAVCGLKQQEMYFDDVFFSTATALVASNPDTEIYPGDPVAVDLDIQDAVDLYAAQALCEVDPAVLEIQSAEFGDFFDPVLRVALINQVDAVDGEWLGAISQQNPADPLSGDGLYATLEYVAQAPGTSNVSCEPIFSDRDGFTLPVTYSGTEITVLPFATLEGVVLYQGRTGHAGIEVTASGEVTQSDETDAAGTFVLDELRSGDYEVEASAALYLPACAHEVTVTSGETVTLDAVTLLGGDLTGNEVIDIGDLSLLGAGFGTPATGADINADGIVNVQDLAILAGNYETSGCREW